MEYQIIYIRQENINNEFRTPLIPLDVKILVEFGFTVFIQSSSNRIYKDEEYKENGGIITEEEWFSSNFNKALVIGIKELNNLDKLKNHIHIYFSHTFKNQNNSKYILESFKNSNSKLYDFEYILDSNKKRLIAFGFYSGIVGAILGLKQYFNKIKNQEKLINLKPWNNFNQIINSVKDLVIFNPKICVIGSKGRCGTGVINILEKFKLSYTEIDREYNVSSLKEFDIIYNCILLDEKYNKIWFDNKTIFSKNTVIVDISCDYARDNNPIKIYNKSTTWEDPIFSYNKFVDIIAIDNLPSLLPKESSIHFSNLLVKLLLDFNSDPNNYWKDNLNIFYEKIKNN